VACVLSFLQSTPNKTFKYPEIKNHLVMIQQSSKEYLGSLNLVFYGLLAGQIIMGIIFIFVNQSTTTPLLTDPRTVNILLIFLALLLIQGVFVSNLLYKKKLRNAAKLDLLLQKTAAYRSALVLRMAMLEVPVIFSIILFYLTSNYLNLAIAGVIILYFASLRPNREKISRELDLNPSDQHKMETPDEVVAEINLKQQS
jgi:hypothetical protein